MRRGLDKIEESAGLAWLQGHLDYTTRPLLSEPWILDIDTTVKPLYGHQEGRRGELQSDTSGAGRRTAIIAT